MQRRGRLLFPYRYDHSPLSLDSRTMADDRRRPRPPSGSGRPPARKPADSAPAGSGPAGRSAKRKGKRPERRPSSHERRRGAVAGREGEEPELGAGRVGAATAGRRAPRRARAATVRRGVVARPRGREPGLRIGPAASEQRRPAAASVVGEEPASAAVPTDRSGQKRGSPWRPGAASAAGRRSGADGFGPYHKDDGDEPAAAQT